MLLETKVGTVLRGIAVASSLYMVGCGTTIHVPKGEIWYDCHTNEEYPQEHPCYAAIEAYKERMAAASVSTASSRDECTSSSGCFSDQRCSLGRCVTEHFTKDNTAQNSGHYVCKKKQK